MNNTVESQNMSVQAIWNIRDARGINANEKAFLFVVASRGIMTAAWQTAAADMGMSKDTFYRTRNSLIKKGLIKEGLRKDTTTVYRLEEKALAALVPAKIEKREEIVWLETSEEEKPVVEPKKVQEASESVQEPVEAPEATKPVTEPQKAAEEPYETSTNLSWGDEKSDVEILAEDVFEEVAPIAPVVEKKAQAPKKARTTKKPVEKVDPMQKAMEQARRRKAVEAEVVEEKLNEADNPVKARELFNDESWKPETTDKVQRASLAALFSTTLEEDKELVAAKSFEMEW